MALCNNEDKTMNLKFFAKLSLSVSVVFSAGCSTAGFWNVPVEPALPYQVLERYPNPVPEWAKDADKFKRERSNDSVIFWYRISMFPSSLKVGITIEILDSFIDKCENN
jgi:hypothetical protein